MMINLAAGFAVLPLNYQGVSASITTEAVLRAYPDTSGERSLLTTSRGRQRLIPLCATQLGRVEPDVFA